MLISLYYFKFLQSSTNNISKNLLADFQPTTQKRGEGNCLKYAVFNFTRVFFKINHLTEPINFKIDNYLNSFHANKNDGDLIASNFLNFFMKKFNLENKNQIKKIITKSGDFNSKELLKKHKIIIAKIKVNKLIKKSPIYNVLKFENIGPSELHFVCIFLDENNQKFIINSWNEWGVNNIRKIDDNYNIIESHFLEISK